MGQAQLRSFCIVRVYLAYTLFSCNSIEVLIKFFPFVINYCGYSLYAPLPPHTAPCSYPFFHCTANCHVQEAHEEPSKIQD